ncbi:DUF4123 domain-containing protein [Dyella kyungheensis]|uniref:DUF4123 domain-containing protein n=1 Tax=Dyella kyungheensis TaxID=1242174 RepID=A0ABS2JWC1_9GAMM|nr:DUF4123 domain-containing protein [Dyella kyungheensis]MBM7123337.1 DUF4123 domain-containing protein [Dyella kyungheensis]
MNNVPTVEHSGLPALMGTKSPSNAIPSTPFIYLLLHTRALEDWAYRPSPSDAGDASAIAPSVTELVRAVSPINMRRWLWDGLSQEPERGPLLVDATDDAPLVQHALEHWPTSNALLFIGASQDIDVIHHHLASLSRFVMPDQGQAQFDLRPDHLSAWLRALDAPHRDAWLGPMTQLLWRESRATTHYWYQLEQASPRTAQTAIGWLHLRADELSAFDHNMRENFITSVANELRILPDYSTLSAGDAESHVRETLTEAGKLNIISDHDFRTCFLLLARHPQLQVDPTAQALLNDLEQSPQDRLRAVAALVNEKEFIP